MNIGMLWYDNNPKTTLDVKIQEAEAYYIQKYGRTPDTCLVHPAVLTLTPEEAGVGHMVGKICVKPFRSVLPGHLWIGVDEKPVAKLSQDWKR